MQPAIFLGHGSPMNAIEDNGFRRSWAELGRRIPRPDAILCISAHWETRGVWLTAAEAPSTVHDFYGFPAELFAVRYPAPGGPWLAGRVASMLPGAGASLDAERGLDHGCWSVLVAMYPEADIPVVQLSLDTRHPPAFHYELAKQPNPPCLAFVSVKALNASLETVKGTFRTAILSGPRTLSDFAKME